MSAANPKTHPVCIALGSNLDPESNISKAAALLHEQFSVQAVSNAWETPPVGHSDGANFINAAMLLKSSAAPEELKNQLREIEALLGRVRTSDKYAPHPIDLDVLLVDDELIEPDLWRYAYLAVPVAELLPELQHPRYGVYLCDFANDLLAENPLRLRAKVSLNPPR